MPRNSQDSLFGRILPSLFRYCARITGKGGSVRNGVEGEEVRKSGVGEGVMKSEVGANEGNARRY